MARISSTTVGTRSAAAAADAAAMQVPRPIDVQSGAGQVPIMVTNGAAAAQTCAALLTCTNLHALLAGSMRRLLTLLPIAFQRTTYTMCHV